MSAFKQSEMLKRMDTLLKEREDMYRDREISISKHKEELKKLETELTHQREEIQAEKALLESKQEQLEFEKKTLERERDELKRYKAEISERLEHLMQEKLEIQGLENERLKLTKDREAFVMEKERSELGIPEESAKLQKLQKENNELNDRIIKLQEEKAELFKKLSESLRNEGTEKKEIYYHGGSEKIDSLSLNAGKEDMTVKSEESGNTVSENNMPESSNAPQEIKPLTIIQQLGELAKKQVVGIHVLESEEDVFRAEVEDKELQFLEGTPHIAKIQTKRKASRELLSDIKMLNKRQQEWKFMFLDGLLWCTMPFPEEMQPEAVLERCMDAMKTYFK